MKKKVLICGASGFIGRNLFEYLSQRSDLDVYGTYLNNPNLNKQMLSSYLLRADLTNLNHVNAMIPGFDCVIHAAAITDGFAAVKSNPGKYLAPNDIMNINLISAVHEHAVGQFIFFSCTVLYPPYFGKPVSENDMNITTIHPPYEDFAWTKIIAEKRCQAYARLPKNKTTYVALRHSNVYGPYDKFHQNGHAVPAFIAQVVNGNDGDSIVINGDGTAQRDFIFVHDLVHCVELVMANQDYKYDVFNVGSDSAISISDLAKKIILISGKNLGIKYNSSGLSVDTKVTLDSAKIKQKLDWQAQVDLDEGIRQTIEWYLKNKERLNGK